PPAVAGVEPHEPGEGVPLGLVDGEAGSRDGGRDGVEVVHHEGRVGLAGRHERILDADVDLRRDRSPRVVRAEPGPASPAQRIRLLDLGEPEALPVEATRVGLAAGRAGDLDVVQRNHVVDPAGTCATTKILRNGSTTRPSRSGYAVRRR